MIQHNQIGKYKGKASIIKAKLNQTYVTPMGDTYSLIGYEKEGRKYVYTYIWLNMPKEFNTVIKKGTCKFLHEARLEEIMAWIRQVKETYREFKP